MIMERLKADTRPDHDRMEQDPLSRGMFAPDLTRDYYARMLLLYYGLYSPLEQRLLALPHWQQLGFDIDVRRKAPLLIQDLAALGVPEEALAAAPRCGSLPALPGLPEALGCLYVLEGATLGGQLMSRHIAATLGIDAASGGAFFNSYGAELGPMWKAFKAFVEQHARPEEAERIVAAARGTFGAMTGWFAEGYRSMMVENAR